MQKYLKLFMGLFLPTFLFVLPTLILFIVIYTPGMSDSVYRMLMEATSVTAYFVKPFFTMTATIINKITIY